MSNVWKQSKSLNPSGMKSYEKRIQKLVQEREHAKQVVTTEKEQLAKVEKTLGAAIEAQQVLQRLAQQLQQKAHHCIAEIVTRCLDTVFGDEAYQFEIQFERKRGKTEAKLVFLRDGFEITPMDAAGGGVIDVAAFALRLACLVLSNPPVRRLLVLDEPFRFLSADYRPRVRHLLESLADDLEVQIVFVTHIPDLQIGEVVEL